VKAVVAVAQSNGVRCEAESGASQRDRPARRTETLYEAKDRRMSLLHKAKPVLQEAVQSRWGTWMEGKTIVLPGEACRTCRGSRLSPAERRFDPSRQLIWQVAY
jgi:hypothetical protein